MKPVSAIDSIPLYLIICAAFAVAAILAIVIPIALARRKPHVKKVSRHGMSRNPEKWRDEVSNVVLRYHAHKIESPEAYAELARIAREFASLRLGTDLTTKTLTDLNLHHQVGGKAHFDSLKQTISALYPAEFADANSNTAAKESSVETAADWVDSMIERWVA
jgi:hypothetical protein